MKKDKQQSSFVNVGSASLLIIFLVLSLVAFAVLSLVSAHSDYKLTGRLAEHKTEYYEASVKAEQILAKMDVVFEKQAEAAGGNLEKYVAEVEEKLPETATAVLEEEGDFAEVGLKCVRTEGESVSSGSDGIPSERVLLEVSFTIPMSEKQALDVCINVNDYTQAETYYNIQVWQVRSTEEWEGDQSIQLLPMGE